MSTEVIDTSEHAFWALILTLLGAFSTCLGGFLIVTQKNLSFRTLGFMEGLSAGVMISLSFFDLWPGSLALLGFPVASFFFCLGVVLFAIIVWLFPEPNLDEFLQPSVEEGSIHHSDPGEDKVSKPARKLLMTGLITALGVSLHNLPEGIAVYFSTLRGLKFGLPLAVCIAFHNLPEGIAVALPVYFATKSKSKAIKWALISGCFEPLGVVVIWFFLPSSLTEYRVQCLLAAVAGIMTLISFSQMLTITFKHCSDTHAVLSIFMGMFITIFTLNVMREFEALE
eukprot:TRINITY_DN2535_c0_g1_i1.p1 TRINITY_DN2535_c0_g1~~TRINITY_DN2535_c0_g1_i1.p1  ORF type:complete len:313 (-),score=52.54 TRINITY_DN2535_c0_g1_i1:228-1076(-)